MWASLYMVLMILSTILVIFLNLLGVLMVLFQLPGTWFMLLCTGLWAVWRWEEQTISIWTLIALLILAIVGEIVETFSSVVTSRKIQSSKRSMVMGILGGIAGAILGTSLIPIPLLGTLIGACVGAGLCAMLGDRWAGRNWDEVKLAGQAAAKGRLLGTVGKVIIAAMMWLIITVAIII